MFRSELKLYFAKVAPTTRFNYPTVFMKFTTKGEIYSSHFVLCSEQKWIVHNFKTHVQTFGS